MKKIKTQDLNRMLKECGIGNNYDAIDSTPYFIIYHKHNWDHGYDDLNGINVYPNGSYDNGCGFVGTRREFYFDMREISDFLFLYFSTQKIRDIIIAPCYRYNQFSFNADKNDIYAEIYSFLRANGIRRGEHTGVEISPCQDIRQVEMIIEGAFRGVSELCLFLPEQRILIAPNHHFELLFFTQNKEQEKEKVLKLLTKFPDLQYHEGEKE